MSREKYDYSLNYDHHTYIKIGLTPVDSGQICFAVYPIKDDWNHENGSLEEMIRCPEKFIAPVTDYDSCAYATIFPPRVGLSPLHRTNTDTGYVIVASTMHGDGQYPIFISEDSRFLIIETGEPKYENDFYDNDDDYYDSDEYDEEWEDYPDDDEDDDYDED